PNNIQVHDQTGMIGHECVDLAEYGFRDRTTSPVSIAKCPIIRRKCGFAFLFLRSVGNLGIIGIVGETSSRNL
ncbi:hypothetical protein, partial [Corynebacterium casei]|uniref:hypothetical protein n=1 Tax=Corynebacterium casei TaxID=160386 RepID=UPI003FD43932